MKKNNRKKGLAFLALCAALAAGGAAGCGKAEVETPPESSIAAEEPAMRESTAAQELTLEEKAAAFRFEALQKIKALPDDVVFYPGHEYTLYAARDALAYLPQSAALKNYILKAQQRLSQGLPVAPVSLGEEKQCNPYLMAATLADLTNLLQ